MSAFYFGPPERRLFGLFEAAQARSGTAALLCYPYGAEAVRTHRVYRVLSERLTRAGIDVMRFDYFATGDSAGDDTQGDLAGWTQDVIAAHEALVARSSAQRVTWFGARLGATLAAMATRRVGRAPNLLVLWDMVVNGSEYLQELSRRHGQILDESYDPGQLPWREMSAKGEMLLEREALGFELGAQLRAQLAQLSAATLTAPRAVRCHLVDQPQREASATLTEKWRRSGLMVTHDVLTYDLDWLAHEALNAPLVPAVCIDHLVRCMTL